MSDMSPVFLRIWILGLSHHIQKDNAMADEGDTHAAG